MTYLAIENLKIVSQKCNITKKPSKEYNYEMVGNLQAFAKFEIQKNQLYKCKL